MMQFRRPHAGSAAGGGEGGNLGHEKAGGSGAGLPGRRALLLLDPGRCDLCPPQPPFPPRPACPTPRRFLPIHLPGTAAGRSIRATACCETLSGAKPFPVIAVARQAEAWPGDRCCAGFRQNDRSTNHAVVSLLHRICNPQHGLDLEPMLYQVPLPAALPGQLCCPRTRA